MPWWKFSVLEATFRGRKIPSFIPLRSSNQAMATLYAFPNTDSLSKSLSDFVERLSEEAISARGHFSVALSGGSLPKLFAAHLKSNPRVDFSRWHIFLADERCVPLDDPESNFGLVKKELLDHLTAQPKVYPINPDLVGHPEKAAVDYERRVREALGENAQIDLIMLGMGPDGHTCSLFPGHPLLNVSERLIDSLTNSPKPPPSRITFTYPFVNRGRYVAFVATGEGKQDVLKAILDHKDWALPSTRVQPESGKLFWFVDEPAAKKLDYSRAEYKL
ncbi:uncharacterized protein VTP21DRAFT_542 [Calcarisporiella thermophila]|uniref:uncharacterized protein n=1 Tax=Calcarisporiella thermophila TaxID=911321 RepID=UPI0037426E84